MVKLRYDEIIPADPERIGVGLPSLDTGGKEWHIAAFKTSANTWDDALASAFALAELDGGKVVFPPWVTVDLHDFTVPAGVELYGEYAHIRRAATFDTDIRHWITLEDDASVDGVILFDGNSDVVAHAGAQSCLNLEGDRCYVGPWVHCQGFATGVCYVIDVYGDDCEVNGKVEDASYASLRLAASVKPLTRFTVGRFESVNASAKGFVYNGTQGVEHVQIGTMILNTDSENEIADGFLTDSESDNSIIRIQRLTIDHLDIYGWQSNGAKIENVGKLEINTFRSRTPGTPYVSGAGLMCRAHEADITLIDSDDRVVFDGTARVGTLRTRSQNQHAVHVTAVYGSQVEIGTLDCREATNTNPSIRIDTAGNPVAVKVGKYLPSTTSPVVLHTVAGTAPANDVGYLTLDRNLPHADGASTTTFMQRIERPPKQFIGADVPTTGTWDRTWIVYDATPSAGGFVGWICTQGGTFGTLNSGSTTGSISSGTNELSVNSATGLFVGRYITIAGVSGIKKVTGVSGTTITLDSNANATVSGAAVAFSAPVFKGFGAIES